MIFRCALNIGFQHKADSLGNNDAAYSFSSANLLNISNYFFYTMFSMRCQPDSDGKLPDGRVGQSLPASRTMGGKILRMESGE
jgi:hypothetical protein